MRTLASPPGSRFQEALFSRILYHTALLDSLLGSHKPWWPVTPCHSWSPNTLERQLGLPVVGTQLVPGDPGIFEDDLGYARRARRESCFEGFGPHVFALRVCEDVEWDFVSLFWFCV